MRSVADDLRTESRRRLARLSPFERMCLALELGDADVALVAAARHITPADARWTIARARQIGRLPSRSNEGRTR